jgi:hypothetical protein
VKLAGCVVVLVVGAVDSRTAFSPRLHRSQCGRHHLPPPPASGPTNAKEVPEIVPLGELVIGNLARFLGRLQSQMLRDEQKRSRVIFSKKVHFVQFLEVFSPIWKAVKIRRAPIFIAGSAVFAYEPFALKTLLSSKATTVYHTLATPAVTEVPPDETPRTLVISPPAPI